MIDRYYRKLMVLHKMFGNGWGSPDKMRQIFHFRKKVSKRSYTQRLIPADYPVYIDKVVEKKDVRHIEGHFYSPIVDLIPEIAPKESAIARFEMLLPTKWSSDVRPICLQLGGTGDHGFGRRRRLIGYPLLKKNGIGSLILENPFYGTRKPPKQFRSGLLHVIDLFTMGLGIILESQIIFNWLEKEGYGPLGVTGISMGGFMASLAAANWPKPVSLIPCLSWSTASLVFTEDVLSESIPWKVLQEQLETEDDYFKNLSLINSPEPHWTSLFENQTGSDNPFSIAGSPLDIPGNQSINIPGNQSIDISGNQSVNFSGTQSIEILGNQTMNFSGNQSMDSTVNILGNQSSSGSDQTVDQSISKACDHLTFDSTLSDLRDKVTAKVFMQGVMDECTHLANYERPVDPELITIVVAENDYYVARRGLIELNKIWPGSKVKLIQGRGHVGSVMRATDVFIEAIAESFSLNMEKNYGSKPTYVNEK